ncbi:LOW QUALITY PROTEIN: E3 ubiquitin-protein ligase listerin-like [Amphiura filiformis]|uniref:LOW QUALITY PROTEIN: E3 ubiquitin-protein ligase listerin-like n=1 Tax=Amphiura filiformis TaxID=82378 RepID=UPI003B21DD25
MSGRQKQRTKGNVKPSSSARTAELMARESGGAMGFIGFGTMSGDLGYVPQTQDDDSQLDGDFRMVLRKLTKKDVVTKLKALQEFGTLCKEKDRDTVTATLPHWSRLYGRLTIDHDKRVREATQQTFQLLVEQVKRNLAPHLRSLMGPWLLAQCDTYPAAKTNARAAFECAFPLHKQPDAIGFCSVQVIQYLQGNLFKETPTTLSDANTTTPEEQEEKYLRVISSSMLALGELVSMVTEKYLTKVSEQLADILGDGKLWKMGKHQSPMVRAAFFSLLGSICKYMPSVAETHFSRISPALLGNLDESESAVVSALWEAVLILVSQLPDCWSHVNPRKAVLPKLWSFLRSNGHGYAATIFPSLLPFLSKIPADVIGDGVAFYGEFFGHLKTGLCKDSVSKTPLELEAVVKAYMECLRYVISRNLSMEENCTKIQNMLIEDHILVLLESSIVEYNSHLSTTSLYSQTTTLISYLQKQTITDQSEASQAANNILRLLWDNITKLCLTEIDIHAEAASEFIDRIVFLLCNLVSPERAEQLLNSQKKVSGVKFDLEENASGIRKDQMDDQFERSKVESQERTEVIAGAAIGVAYVADISDDLVELACRVTNSAMMAAKANSSLPHIEFLSKIVAIFPITSVFDEVLNVNSCLQSDVASAESSDQKSAISHDNVHAAAMECFQQVFSPWVLNLDGDGGSDMKQETGSVVDMLHVVLHCVENAHKAAILDEICCNTRSPLVLHKLVTKIQAQPDRAFLSAWLKSAKFGEKVVGLADSLCHMMADSQSAIRKQSWDLISLGLSTDANGEPKMNAVYAEKVLLKFTEALQSSKVKGHHEEQTHNAVSFICDVASHFFSGVEGCMVIKSTEKLLFALFQIGCSDTSTLSEALREKINSAWKTGVSVLVKQTGGLMTEDGVLHTVASWIKMTLLSSTHTLHRAKYVSVLVKQTGGLMTEDGVLHTVASWIKMTLLSGNHTLHRPKYVSVLVKQTGGLMTEDGVLHTVASWIKMIYGWHSYITQVRPKYVSVLVKQTGGLMTEDGVLHTVASWIKMIYGWHSYITQVRPKYVSVLVKQTGGLMTEDGVLHTVASWIKMTLLSGTHTLHRCHHLAQSVHTLCVTVLTSLPQCEDDGSSLHTIEELLSIMMPTAEEWEANDKQLSKQWQVSVLLNSALTYASLPPTPKSDIKQDDMPTSVILSAFIASLLESRDDEQRLPWQYDFMESAILEMVHALEWCKGMMGLQAQTKVNTHLPPPVSHMPAYCQQVALSLETTLGSVLKTLNAGEWNALISQAISKSLASGGLWALSLGNILAHYECSTSASTQDKCNIYDMIGGPDRLTDMSETCLHTLESVIPYLATDSVLEVLQINIAVLITTDTSMISNISGGLGLLAIISKCCQHPQWDRITQYDLIISCVEQLVTWRDEWEQGFLLLAIITKCCQHPQWDRITQYDLIISCVEQLVTWRDEWEQGFLFNCDLFEANVELIPVNTAIIRFLQQAIKKIPSSLASHHWDFVLCSLVSWIQSCTENIKDLTSSIPVAALCCAVCDLLTLASNLLGNPNVTISNVPSNLATEWNEFFSEAAFTVLLPVLVGLLDTIDLSNLTITQYHLLQSLCEAVSHTPEEHLLDNKLPAKLHAGSWLPDNLQTLTNTLCPMLSKPLRCVQLAAYQMLTKVMPSITKHDEEHLQDSSKDEEEVILTPPPGLKDILDSSEVLMASLLGDVPVGECVVMEPGSEAYHDTLMYMLGWRLYLAIFKAASAEIRASYAIHMRNTKCVEHLLENLFCLMPQVPISSRESSNKSTTKSTKSNQVTMFTEEPQLKIKDCFPSSVEIQHQACAVYLSSLEELPAMVRQWWNSQDKRIAPLVEKFTGKYVSPVLCTRELQGVQCQPTAFDNMTVKARPMTWEVIATYAVEELSMDLVIQLATNHPLGVITVDSGQKVGVSQSQWRNWMLQLTTFLTHQNGSILDGLKLWKRNVDKRFEGVDDCMICFSVIHGSNYSLPKLTCKTCKKKFHSACLYKWFSTSNQSSCPLCRSPF